MIVIDQRDLDAFMLAVGARIRAERLERGLTLEMLGILMPDGQGSPTTLSKLENGKVNSSLRTLATIAAALDVPVKKLIPDDF